LVSRGRGCVACRGLGIIPVYSLHYIYMAVYGHYIYIYTFALTFRTILVFISLSNLLFHKCLLAYDIYKYLVYNNESGRDRREWPPMILNAGIEQGWISTSIRKERKKKIKHKHCKNARLKQPKRMVTSVACLEKCNWGNFFRLFQPASFYSECSNIFAAY